MVALPTHLQTPAHRTTGRTRQRCRGPRQRNSSAGIWSVSKKKGRLDCSNRPFFSFNPRETSLLRRSRHSRRAGFVVVVLLIEFRLAALREGRGAFVVGFALAQMGVEFPVHVEAFLPSLNLVQHLVFDKFDG